MSFSQGSITLAPGGTHVGFPLTTSQVEPGIRHIKSARAQALLSIRFPITHSAFPSIATHTVPSGHKVTGHGFVGSIAIPVEQEYKT